MVKSMVDVLTTVIANTKGDNLEGSVRVIKEDLKGTPGAEIARAFCYMQLEIDKITRERNILKLKEDLRTAREDSDAKPKLTANLSGAGHYIRLNVIEDSTLCKNFAMAEPIRESREAIREYIKKYKIEVLNWASFNWA